MNLPRALRTAAAALFGTALLPAQVLISEVNFTPANASDDQWIELFNDSSSKVDLTTWSMYQATKTSGMPGNYWFGFPPGTEIEPRSFLRVHWNVPVQPSTPTDVYTGNTLFHFLFGYGAESISKVSGAFALLSTQENLQMDSPGVYQDWVQWGDTGFPREAIAISAGRWQTGDSIASPVASDSLALIIAQQGEPTVSNMFFHDTTPTPGADGSEGANSGSYGTACTNGSLQLPTLNGISVPALGNRDFGLRIGNTNSAQQAVLFLSVDRGTGFPILGCPLWVGVPAPIVAQPITVQDGQTVLPIPLVQQFLTRGTVYMQVIVAQNLELAFTAGLVVNLGG